jgi:hypothetical protein
MKKLNPAEGRREKWGEKEGTEEMENKWLAGFSLAYQHLH